MDLGVEILLKLATCDLQCQIPLLHKKIPLQKHNVR